MRAEWRIIPVFLVVVLLAQGAYATPTEILPSSSHYEGQTYFSVATGTGFLGGFVDFAVYDTADGDGDEFADAGFESPGDGRYIYAYQLFNVTSTEAIEYFAVLDIGQGAIENPASDIGSVDDGSGDATGPVYEAFEQDATRAVWEFGSGIMISGEHSYFLVFSSDQDWVKGTFTLQKPDNEIPVPVPEPSMIALFGISSLGLFLKKKG